MRKLRTFFGVVLAVLLLTSACGGAAAPTLATSAAANAPAPITVTDDRGKTFTFDTAPTRVVSLAPSATETIFALGAGSSVVAVDDFSDFPDEAKALPRLGGIRTSPERIVALQPQVVFAITSGDLAERLDALGQPVIVLDPNGLEGVYGNIRLIGTVLGRSGEADRLVATMRQRIGAVAEKARTAAAKPRVMHEVDATDQTRIYVAGPKSFIDEIIGIAGGTNIASAAATKYPRLSPEEIVRANPEVIVLSDFRFGITPELVRVRPGYANISAVRTGRLLPIDDDLVSRPGPRVVLGVEAYAKLLHPELFGK